MKTRGSNALNTWPTYVRFRHPVMCIHTSLGQCYLVLCILNSQPRFWTSIFREPMALFSIQLHHTLGSMYNLPDAIKVGVWESFSKEKEHGFGWEKRPVVCSWVGANSLSVLWVQSVVCLLLNLFNIQLNLKSTCQFSPI